MKFVIAIEPAAEGSAYGVVVPDLPGCFSAGDTLDEAVDQAHEAIDLWCQTMIEDGGSIPVSRTLDEHQGNPDFAGWVWGVADVPVERYLGPAEKINITLPRVLLARVDAFARLHGESRSGLLARAAAKILSTGPASVQGKKAESSRIAAATRTKSASGTKTLRKKSSSRKAGSGIDA